MNMSVLLEVAIGMVALYFLLAAACSFLLEAVHSFTNIRGKAMSKFLIEMLNGPAKETVNSWPKRLLLIVHGIFSTQKVANLSAKPVIDLLSHPLLKALEKPEVGLNGMNTEPSYVPSNLISQALLDQLISRYGRTLIFLDAEMRAFLIKQLENRDSENTLIKIVDLLEECKGTAINLEKLVNALSALNKDEVVKALDNLASQLPQGELRNSLVLIAKLSSGASQDVVDAVCKALPIKEMSFELVQNIVRSGVLPDSLAQSLQPILNSSNYDLQQLSLGLERWYDAVMDRATGWFKRRSILLLGVFAFAFAAMFNFDSFSIAKQLFEKPALRQSAAQLGAQIVSSGDRNGSQLIPMLVLQERARTAEWDVTDLSMPDALIKISKRARETVLLTLSNPSIQAEGLLLLEAEDATALMSQIAQTSCGNVSPSIPKKSDEAAKSKTEESLLPSSCALQQQSLKTADKCQFISNVAYSWNTDLTQASCELFRTTKASDAVSRVQLTTAALNAWKSELKKFQEQTTILNESFIQTSKLVDDIAPFWKLGEKMRWWAMPKEKSAYSICYFLMPILALLIQLFVVWKLPRAAWINLMFFITLPWFIGTCVIGVSWNLATLLPSFAGWLMTALMVSFGAPFWFDLLDKLVSRRAAGPKPGPSDGLGS